MIINQTVDNHDDLLKVVDNLLSEAGLNRADLKGKVTFAGLDPIRPTVLKVGAAGAAVIAANAIASALIYQEKTGEGQDIHVDLRKAYVNQSKWQDVLVDCVTVNGVSRLLGVKGYGESADLHLLPTRDNRFVQVSFPYPSQMTKMCKVLNCGYTQDQLAASSIKHPADELEAMGNSAMVPITKVRTREEFEASDQWSYHISTPLIHIEKVGDSAPEPFPKGDRPLSGTRSLSMVHVVAAPHTQSTICGAGAEGLNLHPADWFEEDMFFFSTHIGYRHAAVNPFTERNKVLKLAKDADVFIENLRPSLIRQEGYSPEALAELRPGMISGSVKCMVPHGPHAQMPGFDFNAAAMTGLFTETGTPHAPAYPNGVNVICDLLSGKMLAIGIQAALLRRAREGGSYSVSVSLAQGCTWLMSLGLVPKTDLLGLANMGPEHQHMKPNLISGKTGYGDTTVIGSQAEMSKTPEAWSDPITAPPGSSYPEWLSTK
jgi:crotonobetainyl-CoA:carnitine CoA-transferase CaiB-like acyl-CoA transferase